MKKLLTVSLLIMLVMGCRSELRIWAKLSQLNSNIPLTTYMPLMITLPECQERGNASQPSESLRQMHKLLNEIFQGVRYQDCHIREAKYKATFLVRVYIANMDTFNGKYEPGIIYIMGNRHAMKKTARNLNDNRALLIGLSNITKNSILRQKKKYGRDMFTSESKLIIYLENDSKSIINNLVGSMLYADHKPMLAENMRLAELENGHSMSIQLSDVLADSFLVGRNETHTVLSFTN